MLGNNAPLGTTTVISLFFVNSDLFTVVAHTSSLKSGSNTHAICIDGDLEEKLEKMHVPTEKGRTRIRTSFDSKNASQYQKSGPRGKLG